eukprot:549468-Amorphochlora_amoeboformis.AAC.1
MDTMFKANRTLEVLQKLVIPEYLTESLRYLRAIFTPISLLPPSYFSSSLSLSPRGLGEVFNRS